jgi:hypothetical protein
LKTSIGKRLNDAFRDLLGFLRIHPVAWVIISGIANRRGNYRIHLVLVSHTGSSRQPSLARHPRSGFFTVTVDQTKRP